MFTNIAPEVTNSRSVVFGDATVQISK